jgi:DNA-binding transcriptional LysR family regulator
LLDDAFKKRGLRYDLVVETDSIEAIKQYVARGTGISVLPDITLSSGDAAELDIYPLTNLLIPEEVGVVTLKGKPLSSTAQNFRDELATIVKPTLKLSA